MPLKSFKKFEEFFSPRYIRIDCLWTLKNWKLYNPLYIMNSENKRSMNTFNFSGSICRKQILTDQYLVILNCDKYYLSSKQNRTSHTFVRSWNNTCTISFYSMYCIYVASTELNSFLNFNWITLRWRQHELSSLTF